MVQLACDGWAAVRGWKAGYMYGVAGVWGHNMAGKGGCLLPFATGLGEFSFLGP